MGDSTSSGISGQVAAQPSATAVTSTAPITSSVQEGVFAEPGRITALSAMVATISADIKADLECENPLGSARLKPELEVSSELHKRLSSRSTESTSLSKAVSGETPSSDVTFLERLAKLSGTSAANR